MRYRCAKPAQVDEKIIKALATVNANQSGLE